MYEALGVSQSGFFAAQQRAASAGTCRDEQLRLVTRAVFAETKGRYGFRESSTSSGCLSQEP
jgi:hypothetical protein